MISFKSFKSVGSRFQAGVWHVDRKWSTYKKLLALLSSRWQTGPVPKWSRSSRWSLLFIQSSTWFSW